MTTPAPQSIVRYTSETDKRSAVVLKDNSILEVKRNGVVTKAPFATYADWLATLPQGAAASVQAPAAKKAIHPPGPEPTTDAEWMSRIVGKQSLFFVRPSMNDNLIMYERGVTNEPDEMKALYTRLRDEMRTHIEAAGPVKAAERKISFKGKPFYIFSESKPEPLWFGRTFEFSVERNGYVYGDLIFSYKGKRGKTFAEAGVPLGPDGWPNLWKIARGYEFKPVPKPTA